MGARGETTLVVGDTEHRILFTNRAIAEAEAAIGKSIISLVRSREPGVSDIGQLLATGLEAARREAKTGGRAYTVMDAYRIMDELGYAAVAKATLVAVANVLSYGSEGVEDTEAELPNL